MKIEMVDWLKVVSMLGQFLGLVPKILSALEKAGYNAEDCHRLRELLDRLSAIAKHLQDTPMVMEDKIVRYTTEGLENALKRASEFATECRAKNFVIGAVQANGTADKLRRICDDILLNLELVHLAIGAYNASILPRIRDGVNSIGDGVNSIGVGVNRILQIIDPNFPPRQERVLCAGSTSSGSSSDPSTEPGHNVRFSSQSQVEGPVQTYSNSTEHGKNKMQIKETDVTRPKVKIHKNNGPGDSKATHASSSDGSDSVESVIITIVNQVEPRTAKDEPAAVAAADTKTDAAAGTVASSSTGDWTTDYYDRTGIADPGCSIM